MAPSASTTLEGYLATPVTASPAMEALRQACLQAVSTAVNPAAQARTLIRRVYDTELKSLFTSIVTLPYDYFMLPLPAPRRLIEANNLLEPQSPFQGSCFNELVTMGLPRSFVDIIEPYVTNESYSNRVAGYCSMVLLAALLQKRS